MKKILLITVFMAAAFTGYAQDPSAAFQVDATDKGFLMPRVVDHTAITTTAASAGLQVYNTTTNKIMLFNGTTWVEVTGASAGKFVDGTDSLDAVYVDGNVGIGTTMPEVALEIKGASANGFLRIMAEESGVAASPYIEFGRDNGSGVFQRDLIIGNGSSSNSEIGIGTDQFLRFDSGDGMQFWAGSNSDPNTYDYVNTYVGPSGTLATHISISTANMGIGTASPESKLDVDGYVTLGSEDTTGDNTPAAGMIRYNSGLQYHDGTAWNTVATGATAGKFVAGNTATDAVYTDGNVGIGTTNPQTTLHIHKDGASQSYITTNQDIGVNRAALWFGSDFDGTVDWAAIGMDSDGSLRLTGANGFTESSDVVITSAGRIGVGTSTPLGGVHIVASGSNNANQVISASGSGEAGLYLDANDGLLSGGNYGSIKHLDDLSLNISNHSLNPIHFKINTASKLTIAANGNVGISNELPSYTLDVNGTTRTNLLRLDSYMLSQIDGEIIIGRDGSGYYIGNGYGVNPSTPFWFGNNNTSQYSFNVDGSYMYLSGDGLSISSTNGLQTPRAKLDVGGYIMLGSADTIADATPQAGMLRFNSTTSKFQGYDGTSWVDLH